MEESPDALEAERLRKKELHRRSMIWTGAMTLASGVAAAYLAFGGGGDLPSWMYGRLRQRPPSAPLPIRRSARGLFAWRPWGPEALNQARRQDRLILLDLRSFWSRAARVMEETVYADAVAAEWTARHVLAVRVDAEERPDLALRYLSGGWPTTALLLPSGEVLDSATALTTAQFLPWVEKINASFRLRRGTVMDAAAAAEEDRKRRQAEEPRPLDDRSLAQALDKLWSGPPFFPRFESAAYLLAAGRAWAPGKAAKLEDPVWGGFFRYAAGPDWSAPQYEKRLEDQAAAVLAGTRRQKTLAYVSAFLSDPGGGFYASQAPEISRPDGHVVEGSYYFTLSDPKRRALGLPPVDKRMFVGENALMAMAVLASPEAPREQKKHALRTLNLLEKNGLEGGLALRRLGGQWGGFLQDQVRLARALAAAGRKEKAVALLVSSRRALGSSSGPALYDRPALGELPEGLDRILVPQLNAELLLLLEELDLPQFNPWRVSLRSWVARRARRVDPALWLRLTSR